MPFKRYLRVEIEKRCERYVESDSTTYRKAVTNGGSAVVYDDPVADGQSSEAEKKAEKVRELAPSTVHRWIGSIASCRDQWQVVVRQAQQSDFGAGLSSIRISPRKYQGEVRRRVLEAACLLLRALRIVQFRNPTEFATRGSSP